ncbi:MAG: hypothetical protein JWP58_2334 [Hymenobacter sp.]|nr:hypothetical protein [Hymenobacter sp.]
MQKPCHSLAFLALLALLPVAARAQSVGIGTTTPSPSAVLELRSTTQGLLLPRLTLAQRTALTSSATAPPVPGLVIYQTDNTPGLYAYDGTAWVRLGGDNLGDHTATQTLNLNNELLTAQATNALGDSIAQVTVQSTVPSKSVAFLTRSYYGRHYTRTMLSGFGMGPYGQEIDYAVWGHAYRSEGWGGIFTAGRPGQPVRWVGLAGHPGYINANSVIRIVDGTQAAGRVLTSDAVGNGKWMPITAAGGNFNLGTYKLVGNGGSQGLEISNSGQVELGDVAAPTLLLHSNANDLVTGGTLQWREDNTAYGWNLRHNTGGSEAGQATDRLILERLNGAGAVSVMSWNQATGNVGIGTLNAGYALDVAGTIRGNNVSASDVRFKQNIRPLGGALAAVLALRGVRYQWNALGVQHGGVAGAEQVGVLAQEIEKVYPELVSTDAQGYKAVNYAQLTPVLLEAIKELKAENDAIKARTEADHADLHTLQQQVARLQEVLIPAAQAQR